MAFKELVSQEYSAKGNVIGGTVQAGLEVAKLTTGALSGFKGGALSQGIPGVKGAAIGAMRLAGINSPGAQIALLQITQAQNSNEAQTEVSDKISGLYKDITLEQKDMSIRNKIPAEYLLNYQNKKELTGKQYQKLKGYQEKKDVESYKKQAEKYKEIQKLRKEDN